MKLSELKNKEFIEQYNKLMNGCGISDYVQYNNELFKRFIKLRNNYIKLKEKRKRGGK